MPHKHSTSCITLISRYQNGRAHTVYLRDGTKIMLHQGRIGSVGDAWLEISEQARIIPLSSGVEVAQSSGSLPENNKERCDTVEENQHYVLDCHKKALLAALEPECNNPNPSVTVIRECVHLIRNL